MAGKINNSDDGCGGVKDTRIRFLMELALRIFSPDCQSNMLSVKTVSENTTSIT